MIRITETAFDPEAELAAFRKANACVGALTSFTGVVRDDGATENLTLSHYPGFTERHIKSFVEAAKSRWDVTAVHIIHRVGRMKPGEPIVFVATASAHRRAAFEACDYLMDRLKSDAPFWKSEMKAGKKQWIEPRAQDAADLARWS
ncbi:molybdenum cofactor biosynthesis protein MoaE [Litorimonas sp. WD9-15]|uniref:molybdenum cofactor biosynthesis protein MoaE n=1 Tax=Litorimonas sp. WD9-15 TaxID=3418716 RepID=UPI003D058303